MTVFIRLSMSRRNFLIMFCLFVFFSSEIANALGKDNLQKCYDVMANVQNDDLVKVNLQLSRNIIMYP